MRESKHTDEQIVAILKEVESSTPVLEVSRKNNLQPQTIYRWIEKFGGSQDSDVRKMMEDEAMNNLIQKKFQRRTKKEAWLAISFSSASVNAKLES